MFIILGKFCNIPEVLAAMTAELITSRHNPAIAEALKLVSDTKYRREMMQSACEGTKLFADASESGAEILTVIASESVSESLPAFEAGRFIVVPDRLFGALSTQKSPQGVLFFCRRPKQRGSLAKGRYAVLDGLQDPGNVGTAIRTSAALGIDGVILCGSSADPFGPKAARASMGAVFRIPIFEFDAPALRSECEKAGIKLYAAMPAGDAEDIRRIGRENLAVVIGSEGSGVSGEILEICEGKITIPMANGTESLNAAAAAAVILWEIARETL
jgi:TrmH family RNA methyltransferase